MESNLTYWAPKLFFSWFIVSKAKTIMVIISSNFLMTTRSFPIRLCKERFFFGNYFEKLQLRNFSLIKEPFNHVNLLLTCIFNSRGSFDIVSSVKSSSGGRYKEVIPLTACRHIPQIILVRQLRISQTLHHDRRIFLKFLKKKTLHGKRNGRKI